MTPSRPTESDAREYLDSLDPWDLEDLIVGVDPEDALDPWDLDAALVAEGLHYLRSLASK